MDYEITTGIMGGLVVGYNGSDNLGLQLEFNYAQAGQTYQDQLTFFGSPFADVKKEVKLSYWQIPILFKYTAPGNTARANIVFGPQIGILNGAEINYFLDGSSVKYETYPGPAYPSLSGPKDFFNKIDVGIALGIGVDIFVLENLYLSPGLRIYGGITDINSEETRDNNDYTASRNGAIGLNVGVHFLFGN